MRRPVTLLAFILLLAAVSPAAAQPIVIDDFTHDSTTGVYSHMSTGTFLGVASPGGVILQAERNLKLVVTAVGSLGEVDFDVSGGTFNFVRSLNSNATGEVWWDGQNGMTTFDPAVGLGGITLSGGGRTAFLLTVSSTISGSGASTLMKLTVYSSATAYSEATFDVGGISSPTVVTVLFSSFAQGAGATSPANFGSVRLIDLKNASPGPTGFFFFNIMKLATDPDCSADVTSPTVTAPGALTTTQTKCQ